MSPGRFASSSTARRAASRRVLADSLGDRREELHRAWVEFFETEDRAHGEIAHTREYLLVVGERR